ncbi:MAG: glycosyltransferase family 4 protein [Micavibrio aeruginosavorus]|uniref:Glycosyltransferase family 4 protein n=1 Tax=Micavibrio aeruginosavorus TaxID=349221 RepID=A0A7T5R3M4_9BACT|nr:MAG: glycosyltransferase family 4 protein [Micavibrio aeruginosavorus]
MKKPLLMFVVTEDWYFLSHRMPTVKGAQAAGYDVAVVTADGSARAAIEAQGVRIIPFSFDRRSLNPFKALRQIGRLRRIYQAEKPQIIHHIAMKPILFGTIAAIGASAPHVVNAFAGLGYVFSAQTALARAMRLALIPAFRIILNRPGYVVLFQNRDDRALLQKLRALPSSAGNTVLIRGSGVDTKALQPSPLPDDGGDFICVFAGRMIGIKGLPTLQEAFARLQRQYPRIKLWLCGQPDPGNPGSWTQEQIDAWAKENPNVIFKGHCLMNHIWPQAHAALQPSYGGEGIPKSLLEAAACGRPIIATDVPGCRDMVDEAVNGFLVPPHDAALLAERIALLAGDRALCQRMGQASRALVEGELSADAVTEKTQALYESLRAAA